MNAREMEQAVKTLQADMKAMREAHDSEMSALVTVYNQRSARIDELATEVRRLRAEVVRFGTEASGAKIVVHRRIAEVEAKLDELTVKVEGRNRSAAVKRNMVDADAKRVLSGDLAATGHKEAAEVMGLTYAQVYSCRLGFTFKHVHRDLEKSGWKSKWAKG